MRDSNYKSVAQNKAAVSITTTLYDRRALDATCDQPLVNSLNHLTYLTSSSAKVRDTLATDGGLERLVCILHECRKQPDLTRRVKYNKKKTIKEEKESALIAWKWALAFQCLVLIGTRGTEQIRKRVVEAGIIPIIATVLDNYLLIVRNFDNETDQNFTEPFIKIVSSQLHKTNNNDTNNKYNNNNNDSDEYENNDGYYSSPNKQNFNDSYDLTTILDKDSKVYQYLKKNNPLAQDDSESLNSSLEVDESTVEQNLHDINERIASPRVFLNGILVPKDDDIVWSLQLLAFISKYSALKDTLQFTHLVDTLSLRSMVKGQNSLDPLSSGSENEDFGMDNDVDYDLISSTSSDDQFKSHTSQIPLVSSEGSPSQSQTIEPSTQESSTILIQRDNISDENIVDSKNIISALQHRSRLTASSSSSLLSDSSLSSSTVRTGTTNNTSISPDQDLKECFRLNCLDQGRPKSLTRSLLNSIMKCEKNCKESNDPDTKAFCLIELNIKLSNCYKKCKFQEKLNSIANSKAKRLEYQSKWNYENYFNNPNNAKPNADFDPTSIITHPLNIFPLVEKFTDKSINIPDMCYWSGVIMRNSCRKDEQRGGVRQCASFDCGKWETYPREFAKCRRCKRTKYCSKDCQLRAWIYHKHWCVDSNSSSAHGGSSSAGTSHATTSSSSAVAPSIHPEMGRTDVNGLETGTTTTTDSEIVSRDEMVTSRLNELL